LEGFEIGQDFDTQGLKQRDEKDQKSPAQMNHFDFVRGNRRPHAAAAYAKEPPCFVVCEGQASLLFNNCAKPWRKNIG